jgi:hypothetical protein
LKGTIEDETRQLNDLLVGVSSLQVSDEEGMGTWDGDLILKLF